MITPYSKYDYTLQDYPIYSEEDCCQANQTLSLRQILENFTRVNSYPSIPDLSGYDKYQDENDFDTTTNQTYVDITDFEAARNLNSSRIHQLEMDLRTSSSERASDPKSDAQQSNADGE